MDRFIFHYHAQWIQLNLERENDVTTLYEQWLSIIMLAIFNCRLSSKIRLSRLYISIE